MKSVERKTEPLSIKANALWNSIGSIFYLGCQWLVTVLVVVLSSDYTNSGVLAFVMGTGVVFSAIAVYSIRPYQVSDLDKEYSNANYIAFRLITNGAGVVIFMVYTLLISGEPDMILTTFLYLLFKVDECFADVLYGIYQSNYRMDYIGVSQLVRGVLSLAGFSVGLVLTDNINIAIVAMLALCMIVTIIYDLPHASLFGSVIPSISSKQALTLARECFFGMLACTLIGWISTIARQYLGLVEGDEALGIYAALAAPAVLVQVAANYLYSPFLRELAKTARQGRSAFLKKFLSILLMLFVLIVALVMICIPIGSFALPLIYGDSISDHVYVFSWVLVATGALGVLYYFYNTLITLRLFTIVLLMAAISLGVALVTSFAFTPAFGMNAVNYSIISGACVGVVTSFAGILFYSRTLK